MSDTIYKKKSMSIEDIKRLALIRTDDNLNNLINLFHEEQKVDIKREIASSIGRGSNLTIIYDFLNKEFFEQHYMDIIYQFYRTCLYKSKVDDRFKLLGEKALNFYKNEVMQKMKRYYYYKKDKSEKKHEINRPTLLIGDNQKTLLKLPERSVNFIFTSPPYYNAREYADYCSYQDYLGVMQQTLYACNRVLETGRFIIVNVSPIITKRAGREFESIRYPIHFDFHSILQKAGFYFVDEIIWLKPDYCVPNRVAGYAQSLTPLAYKPNAVTESLLVYRKNADFLLDENIKKYNHFTKNSNDFERTNCWQINPKTNKNHPAVFPEELCERVLEYYSFDNDVVLDPFAGSGTFGRVAIKMNRIPVLCEHKMKYINLIKKGWDYAEIFG